MNNWRKAIETLADEIEGIVRFNIDSMQDIDRKDLFRLAWDLKQIARRSTASEGI